MVLFFFFLVERQPHQTISPPPPGDEEKSDAILYRPFFPLHLRVSFLLLLLFFVENKKNKAERSTQLFRLYQLKHLTLCPTSFLCKMRGLKSTRNQILFFLKWAYIEIYM